MNKKELIAAAAAQARRLQIYRICTRTGGIAHFPGIDREILWLYAHPNGLLLRTRPKAQCAGVSQGL